MKVISSQGYEEACKIPVAVATAVFMAFMLPVKIISMFTLFTKMDKMFNPNRIHAKLRQQAFTERLTTSSDRSLLR